MCVTLYQNKIADVATTFWPNSAKRAPMMHVHDSLVFFINTTFEINQEMKLILLFVKYLIDCRPSKSFATSRKKEPKIDKWRLV